MSEGVDKMKNIVLARVDDRLIHGEVVSVWMPNLGVNRIIIADDSVAADQFNSRVIKALAPLSVKVNVCTVNEASEKLKGEPIKNEKVMVLAKTPISFERMLDNGVELRSVNLGGMGIREGRSTFIKNVACDTEEMNAIRNIINNGVYVFYQLVPEQQKIEVTGLV